MVQGITPNVVLFAHLTPLGDIHGVSHVWGIVLLNRSHNSEARQRFGRFITPTACRLVNCQRAP
jgi:hypothetical protein